MGVSLEPSAGAGFPGGACKEAITHHLGKCLPTPTQSGVTSLCSYFTGADLMTNPGHPPTPSYGGVGLWASELQAEMLLETVSNGSVLHKIHISDRHHSQKLQIVCVGYLGWYNFLSGEKPE